MDTNEIIQPTRPGAIDKTSSTPSGFPNFAFEHDGDGKTAEPTLTLISPWNFGIAGDLGVVGDLDVDGDTTLDATEIVDLTVTNSATFQGSAEAEQGITVPVMHVQDQKPSGTDGGTFTLGDWRTRDLNEVLINTITGASLSSNQITLPAGTYKISASAPAFAVNQHKAKLYNITDASDTIIGTSEYNAFASPVQSRSIVSGLFTITGTKVFELQHRCSQTKTNNGLGVKSDYGIIEVYPDVFIEKIA